MKKLMIISLMTISAMLFMSYMFDTKTNLGYKLTRYTLEDIKAKTIEGQSFDPEDTEESDLEAYSKMLSYMDECAGSDSYYIYDAYYVETTKSHVVKVILKDYYDEYLLIKDRLIESRTAAEGNNCIIMLTYDKELGSHYEPFLMARNWYTELKSEFGNSYGDYYINSFYIALDYMVPNPNKESYVENTDWKHFYNEEGTYKRHLYENWVSIIFPEGTTKEDMNDQINKMESLFHKYCITIVEAYILKSKDVLDIIKKDELMTENSYYFCDEDYFSYKKTYKITKE